MLKKLLALVVAPIVLVLGLMSPAHSVAVYPGEWICYTSPCTSDYYDSAYDTWTTRIGTGTGEALTGDFDTLLMNNPGEKFTVEIKYRGVSGLAGAGVFSVQNNGYAGWICNTPQTAASEGYKIKKCVITNPPEGSSEIHLYAHGTGTHAHVKYVKIVSYK